MTNRKRVASAGTFDVMLKSDAAGELSLGALNSEPYAPNT